jgi:hypothetical protein
MATCGILSNETIHIFYLSAVMISGERSWQTKDTAKTKAVKKHGTKWIYGTFIYQFVTAHTCQLSHLTLLSRNNSKTSSVHKRAREFFAGHRCYEGGRGGGITVNPPQADNRVSCTY